MKSKPSVDLAKPKFSILFLIFLIVSVIGAIYEDIYIYLTTGVFMVHRGVIYGPFNIIYGAGAIIMVLLFTRKPLKNWQLFVFSALLGGAFEYLMSYLQELITGTRSWDYSSYFLNINGRTTIPIMLVWGAVGFLFLKFLYPWLYQKLNLIPNQIMQPLFVILLVFMIVDIVISWSAVIRQTLRHNDIPAFTPIGQTLDQIYPDEVLIRYYPNMRRVEK